MKISLCALIIFIYTIVACRRNLGLHRTLKIFIRTTLSLIVLVSALAAALTFSVFIYPAHSVYEKMQKQSAVGGYPDNIAPLVGKLRFLEVHRSFLRLPYLIDISRFISDPTLRGITDSLNDSDGDRFIFLAWHDVMPFWLAGTHSPRIEKDDYVEMIKKIGEHKPSSLYGELVFQPHAIYMLSQSLIRSEFSKPGKKNDYIYDEIKSTLEIYSKITNSFQCGKKQQRLRELLGLEGLERTYFENGFALWDAFLQEKRRSGHKLDCSYYPPLDYFYQKYTDCFSEGNFSGEYSDSAKHRIQDFISKRDDLRNMIIKCSMTGSHHE